MLTIRDRDCGEWCEGMTVHRMLDDLGHESALIAAMVNGELVPEDKYDTRPATSLAVREAIH